MRFISKRGHAVALTIGLGWGAGFIGCATEAQTEEPEPSPITQQTAPNAPCDTDATTPARPDTGAAPATDSGTDGKPAEAGRDAIADVGVDAPKDAGRETGPFDAGNSDAAAMIAAALLNIDFGNSTTTKVGASAAGKGPSDHWNAAGPGFQADYTLTTLVWADGTAASGVSMRAQNLPGNWGWTSSIGDLMYNGFSYSWSGATATVTVSGLPAGTYDFVAYGHGGADNSGFSVAVKSTPTGPALRTSPTRYTSTGPDYNSSIWRDGSQFVILDGIVVGAGEIAELTIYNGKQGTGNAGCIINGLQILRE